MKMCASRIAKEHKGNLVDRTFLFLINNRYDLHHFYGTGHEPPQ